MLLAKVSKSAGSMAVHGGKCQGLKVRCVKSRKKAIKIFPGMVAADSTFGEFKDAVAAIFILKFLITV